MSANSPITETILFLYAAITSTKCNINFQAVGVVLNLKTGTAAMRFRRLKERIDKQTGAGAAGRSSIIDENTLFLYQCMVASNCKPDWNVVGAATGLKAGTASMRWRRLSEKIEKERGTRININAPVQATSKAAIPRKRKSGVKIEAGAESDGEVIVKKIKTEEATALPEENRQTRGRVLDFKDMFDNSSSTTGNSTAATSASSFETRLAEDTEHDDENSMVSKIEARPRSRTASAPRKIAPRAIVDNDDVEDADEADDENSVVTKPMPKPTNTKPSKVAVGYVKSTPVPKRTVAPLTPQSGAPSSTRNPKPTGSSIGKFSFIDAPPTPITPGFPDIVPSIESDETHGIVDVKKVQGGRLARKRTSHMSNASSESLESNEVYESVAESASSSESTTSSILARVLSDDEMSSIAPEDSVSMTGKWLTGGKQKRTSQANNTGLLGKL